MTIDDDNSVYVGGLPYDATEDIVRDAFDLYGSVVAVKIINDRGVGGKCYGFVTFTNPRAAVDAINDMNGRTIGGRVVRVNEVRTRGGRSNFSREALRRNSERGMDWDRGRDRERDYDRDRHRDRNRDRSRDHDQDREREYENMRDRDRERDWSRDRLSEKHRDQDRDMEDIEQERGRNYDRGFERENEFDRNFDLDWDRNREMDRASDLDRSGDKDKDEQPRKQKSSNLNDQHSRDLSSNSSGDYHAEVKEQLELSIQRLEQLQKEIPQIEDRLEERRQVVLDLQKKSQKLEDALTSAKKLSSHRQMMLMKLRKCFLQVKDHSERLKSSERELQSLVDTTMIEVEVGDAVGSRDGILINGNA